MSDLTATAIEVVLKHLTDRIALAVLAMSLILCGSMAIPGDAGNWARAHRMWIAFGILGPICYLPTRFILGKFPEWGTTRKRESRLKRLTAREKAILAPYVRNDFRARRIFHSDPVAQGLADDGVLYAPNVAHDQTGGKAYNIQDWARVYLRKHPDLIGKIEQEHGAGDV